MSIKNQQIQTLTETIIDEELRHGNFPELTTVRQKVATYFANKPAGLPRYDYEQIEADSISDPQAFNKSIEDIYHDLATAFRESQQQSNRMMTVSNDYETQKNSIVSALKEIENRIDILLNELSNDKEAIAFFDSFDNFNKIEFEDNDLQNIPKTDIFVDLKHGQISLDQIHTGAIKYDLSQASYSLTSNIQGAETKPMSNAFRDTINESWEYLVTTDTEETVSLEALIELNEAIDISVVSLQFHSPRQTNVTLSISEDGEIYQQLNTQESYNLVEWQVSARNTKYLKFVFSKNNADIINGTDHEYYFGASSINVQRKNYLEKGFLISKPFEVTDKVINEITLREDSVVFPGTNIRYSIGIDNNKTIEWQEVKPDQPLKLKGLSNTEVNLMEGNSGYGEKDSTHFDVDYYSIGEMDMPIESATTEVYMGEYMWMVEQQEVNDEEGLSLHDWTRTKQITTSFISIEQTIGINHFVVDPQTMYRMTTYVYCDTERDLFNSQFTVGDAELQVYVNNVFLKPVINNGVHQYNYHFDQGWNEIQVLVKTKDNETSIRPNLYLKDIASRIFSHKNPLTEVSPYDLYNNTSKFNYFRYTVEDNKIIVNYDPKALDHSENGIRYKVYYQYAPSGVKRNNRIRIMAELSRNQNYEHITPILNNYQLIIK